MASLSDVEQALVSLIDAQLYPSGSPPSAVAHPVKIYAGWPDSQQLDADLVETSGLPAASHVSIYPLPTERNTTRFPNEAVENPIPSATYTLTVSGQTITAAGTAPSPWFATNFAVYVDGTPYVAQSANGDSLAAIAAKIATSIQVGYPGASASGAVVTLPNGPVIGNVLVGVTGSTVREVRRQEKQYQISVWTSNPTLRAQIADLFDPVMGDTPRITLADNTVGHLTYHATRDDDFLQKQRIYRRSLIYAVEYGTTITTSAAELIVPVTTGVLPPGFNSVAGPGALDFSTPNDSDLIPSV